MARLMCGQPERSAGQELHDVCRAMRLRLRFGADVSCARTGCPSATIASPTIIIRLSRVAPLLHSAELGICGLAEQAQRDRTAVVIEWKDRRQRMLETIAIVLIVLWLLGVVSGYTLGNFIYVLLVVAIVLFLVRLISGRRVV